MTSSFWKSYLAEFVKVRHSLLLRLHLILPVVIVSLVTLYLWMRPDQLAFSNIASVFFELLGFGIPFLIAVFCGLKAQQEQEAGGSQNMLRSTRMKAASILSQLCMLATLGLLALGGTVMGMYAAMKWLLGTPDLDAGAMLRMGLLTAAGMIICYAIYLILAYLIGLGGCSLLGFVGMIAAALSLTSLGDQIWLYVPWSWPIRLSSGLYMDQLPIIGAVTLIVVAVSALWFQTWNGRPASD